MHITSQKLAYGAAPNANANANAGQAIAAQGNPKEFKESKATQGGQAVGAALSLTPKKGAGEADPDWVFIRHRQPVVIERANGARRIASFVEMNEDILLAGPKCPTQALFSTGFASCVAIVLVNGNDVGMAHSAMADEGLTEAIEGMQEEFEETTGRAPATSVVYQFEDGLRAELSMHAEHSVEDFRDSWKAAIRQGRDLKGAHDSHADRTTSEINAVVAYLNDQNARAAQAAQARIASARGHCLLVESGGYVEDFPVEPPCRPAPSAMSSSISSSGTLPSAAGRRLS